MENMFRWLCLALVPLALAHDYCSVCTDHTMCRFTSKNPACGATSESGVSPSEARQIVDLHNTYRAKIANGQETRGRPGPQPPAGNMRALVWDPKLAEVAQRWADQCTFQHDNCRNDPRFKVGQNIYWSTGFSTVNWTRAVSAWYNEVKDFAAQDTRSFELDPTTGHYTQIAWATTTLVGCGRTTYGAAYRPQGHQPREFILAATPSRNDTSDRKARLQGASFEDASFDPAGAHRDIDASSEQLSDQNRQKRQNGFFGGAHFNPAGAQGAITGSSGGEFGSTGSYNGNGPSRPSSGNFANNGNKQNINPGYFGGATFDPAGAQGAITASGMVSGPSNGNRPQRPPGGNGPSNGNGGSPNYPGTNGGNRPTNPNYPSYPGGNGGNRPSNPNYPGYPSYPSYPIAGNEPNYPNYEDNSGFYPGDYELNFGSPFQTGEEDLIELPAGSVPVGNEDPSHQTVGNAWMPFYYNHVGYDQILICNYGPAGNWPGQSLYMPGQPCSHCPSGTICDNSGLCVAG